MSDSKTTPAPSSQAGDFQPWLAAYLHHRAHLASHQSDFHCHPVCTRPGCRNQDLQIQVSLIDLLGAAGYRHESVAPLYRRHYTLGLFADEGHDWLRRVALKLTKPCPFLEHDLCTIYPVRPLPCILFPEYLAMGGTQSDQAGLEHFRDYLCLQQPLQLSPARTLVVAQLQRLWARESLFTSFYLFQHRSCHVDFSHLRQELLAATTGFSDAATPKKAAAPRFIPHQVLEAFFFQHLAGYQPFAGVTDKISRLDNPDEQEQFRKMCQDERLRQKLQQGLDDRTLVLRFANGKLKARRQSLLAPHHKFSG
jgi:Fe-S-cluster containining protein